MGRYLSSFDWLSILATSTSYEDMWNLFHNITHIGLHYLMPLKHIRICNSHAPWMTQNLKQLILKMRAFNTKGADSATFTFYGNMVNRKRKSCRAKYYEPKLQHMKGENPKRWWSEVKRPSGMKSKNSDLLSLIVLMIFTTLTTRTNPSTTQAATVQSSDHSIKHNHRTNQPSTLETVFFLE